jgi:hypothetical protein
MDQQFDDLLNEYELKVQTLNEINADLARLLNSMKKILIEDKTNAIKLENMMHKYSSIDSDIVDFNIGGSLFSISKDNICKKIQNEETNEFYGPNLLHGLISGIADVKYKENAIFIDRNPKYFPYILDYLRVANTSIDFEYPENRADLNGLYKEAEFYKIEGLKENFENFNESLILDRKKSRELIQLCGFSFKDKWSLLYRGSSDGFGARDFHAKCDRMSKTLSIIKTTQAFIFGGYAEVEWNSTNTWKMDVRSFIYSLVNKENSPIKIKFDVSSGQHSIYCGSSYGPTFGNDHAFYISDNSNLNTASYSNLGGSFKHPEFEYNSNEARTFLAGSYNFQITEIEVYRKI